MNAHIDGLMSGLATRYELGSERDLVGRLIADRSVGGDGVRTSLFAEMTEGDGILLERLVTRARPVTRSTSRTCVACR